METRKPKKSDDGGHEPRKLRRAPKPAEKRKEDTQLHWTSQQPNTETRNWALNQTTEKLPLEVVPWKRLSQTTATGASGSLKEVAKDAAAGGGGEPGKLLPKNPTSRKSVRTGKIRKH